MLYLSLVYQPANNKFAEYLKKLILKKQDGLAIRFTFYSLNTILDHLDLRENKL